MFYILQYGHVHYIHTPCIMLSFISFQLSWTQQFVLMGVSMETAPAQEFVGVMAAGKGTHAIPVILHHDQEWFLRLHLEIYYHQCRNSYTFMSVNIYICHIIRSTYYNMNMYITYMYTLHVSCCPSYLFNSHKHSNLFLWVYPRRLHQPRSLSVWWWLGREHMQYR